MGYVHEKALKPLEVEEPLDRFFYRPLASLFVRSIYQTRLTPNGVTLLSLLFGVSGGMGLYLGWLQPATAGLLLVIASVLDCADGQLARSKGISSPTGRLLDGLVDAFVTIAVFAGAASWLADATGDARMWKLAGLAGAFMFARATLYDMVKNRYNLACHPEAAEGNESLSEVWANARAAFAKGRLFEGVLHTTYLLHSPMMRWLSDKLNRRSGGPVVQPVFDMETRLRYSAAYRPVVRMWVNLGISSHLGLLSLGLLLASLSPRYLEGAFWMMVGPLNLVMLACFWVQIQAWWRFRREEPTLVTPGDPTNPRER